MKRLALFALVISVACLQSCAVGLKPYESTSPALELEKFFDGKMIAYGVIQDYREKLTRHFCVELEGVWKKNELGQWMGELDETFYFSDNVVEKRLWKLLKIGEKEYQGTAGDVVGNAKGKVSGMALNWHYKLTVPIGGKEYVFKVDDWIYQLDENTAYNRSKLKKFGVTLGEISIFFDRTPASYRCQDR